MSNICVWVIRSLLCGFFNKYIAGYQKIYIIYLLIIIICRITNHHRINGNVSQFMIKL